MKIDDLGEHPEFPRKMLDKKAYVRLDPESGLPQLIRVEPHIAENGEILLGTVIVTIDNSTEIIMERDVAEVFIESQNCVPLEEFSDWKHGKVN